MSIDNLLDAIAALCPANIPKIEALAVVDLKVGDECVLVWSKDKEVWKVKAFCSDGNVDIVDEKYNAHMSVPSHELRLAKLVEWDIERNETDYEFYFDGAWNAQQSKIDELQKQVDAAFRVLSQLNALDDEAHKRWKREACMFSQGESNAYEHAVRLLEQALKGGDQNTEKQPNKHAKNIATKGVKGGDQ